MDQASRSFTSIAVPPGLLPVLSNECEVSQAFTLIGSAETPPRIQFNAIWDTGATGCVITQRVVDACDLTAIGLTNVQGVGGIKVAEKYLVNIYLPNLVVIPNIEVTKGELGPDSAMLIGMNVISQGDFAVTNAGGHTKFSFRMPSLRHIDFVKEQETLAKRTQAFNNGRPTYRGNQSKSFRKNKRKKKK